MNDVPFFGLALGKTYAESRGAGVQQRLTRLRAGNAQSRVELRHRHRGAYELLQRLVGSGNAVGVLAGHEFHAHQTPVRVHLVGENLWQPRVHALPYLALREADDGASIGAKPDPVRDLIRLAHIGCGGASHRRERDEQGAGARRCAFEEAPATDRVCQ